MVALVLGGLLVAAPVAGAAEVDGGAASGFDPAGSVVVSRDERSTVYANPDGTFTTEMSAGPLNYLDGSGSWQAIDNRVVADPAQPGGLRNRANSWRVHFGTTSQGVVLDTGAGSLGLAPDGAAAVAPVAANDPDGSGVVWYPGAWPGADLRYRVLATGVKESVLIKDKSAGSRYGFSVRSGAAAKVLAGQGSDGTVLDVAADGSAVPADAGLASEVVIATPVVRLADGAPVEGSGARLSGSAGRLVLSVDPAWLASLPDSAFPVDLDPTLQKGWDTIHSFKSDGATCSGANCVGVQFGNARDGGDTYWRTVAHFPYESLFGQQVLSAKFLQAWEGGTKNGYTMAVYWASASSYAGARSSTHPTALYSGALGTAGRS
ncbi:MAG: hypothetical protein FWD74_01335 [Actinomycetia bacterium]|nr:hypothetical protein [Actinomycetes bacterium]